MTELTEQSSQETVGYETDESDDQVLSIIKELECPICYEITGPPIYMCQNGHNVCHVCQPQMNECATCRDKRKPDIRNRFAESVYEALTVPCPNADRGCQERVMPHCTFEHARKCRYAPHTCLFCEISGTHDDILKHLDEKHPEIDQIDISPQRSRIAALLVEFKITTALIHDNALFWFCEQYDEDKNTFSFSLFKCGPVRAGTPDYYCTIRFTSENLEEELTFHFPIPVGNVYWFPNERSVTGNTLDLLSKTGELHYGVTITHRDEEKERVASEIETATFEHHAVRVRDEVCEVMLIVLTVVFLVLLGGYRGWWQFWSG